MNHHRYSATKSWKQSMGEAKVSPSTADQVQPGERAGDVEGEEHG